MPTPENQLRPLIPAKWQTVITTPRDIRLIVIHCMESPEKIDTAENVGLYFQRGESRASAHVGVDSDSVVQYVPDNNVAWAAPGVNSDGIHIELAGMSNQTVKEWQDPYSVLMLDRAADVAAQYCQKYSLPPVHLTNAELSNRHKGIIGHAQATAIYKPNQGHQDPGPLFPWNFFIQRVAHYCDTLKKQFASVT
jgi:N-acetyl-anhydromuramyl-L-alanine amidase AmpD